MEVNVKILDRPMITFKVELLATVQDIKSRIEEMKGISKEYQRLFYENKELTEEVLKNYCIKKGSFTKLTLTLKAEIKVYIQTSIKLFPLHVDLNDTIAQVKERIYRKEGIPPSYQMLLRSGYMCDTSILGNLKIKNENVIKMIVNEELGMELFVKTLTGRTIVFDMKKNATVDDLMLKIQHAEGMPVDSQRLVFAGKRLHPETYLSDYNITHQSTIHLVLRFRDRM